MRSAVDPTLRNLTDCGCCEGIAVHTPARVDNRPGLKAIAYRVGTHAQFKQSMLARLQGTRERAALADLNTRDDDDFAIALLDAWATVADVLTFYQERMANESYLKTATERLSLLHLARLIGYELRPGVAASTYLAFTVDEEPGSATIEAGTRVQSIPKNGGQPQVFETVETIEGRFEWNTIKPRLTKRHPYRDNQGDLLDTFFFQGAATGLKPGDGILIVPDDDSKPNFRLVSKVTPQPEQDWTKVQVQPPPDPTYLFVFPMVTMVAAGGPKQPSSITRSLLKQTINAFDLKAMAMTQGFHVKNVFSNLKVTQQPPPGILAFRKRASIFGHNAPEWKALPVTQRIGESDPNNPSNVIDGPYKSMQSTWVDRIKLSQYPGAASMLPNTAHVYLDNTYPEIVKGSWIVLQDGSNWRNYQVQETTEVSKSEFTLNAKVTRLTLESDGLNRFGVRTTTVFAQSEEIRLARLSIEGTVSGTQIETDGWVEGLSPGQSIIICGELDKDRGNQACEHAAIDEVEHLIDSEGFTRIKLRNRLKNDYVRSTVTINANVALATHGDTKQEFLGSGDGSQAYQRFMLKHPPLTHVSGSTPSGSASTLEVRVNDIQWEEAENLAELGPNHQSYITRLDDEGKTVVIFGNGRQGSRLPTGLENVKAVYRSGIGRIGNVAAKTITLLAKRPPGVRSVTNPIEATGGDDSEGRDQVRQNAPLTVLALDRIVSLQDYEDFARAFAGVSKALATWTWNGQVRGVHVTVAGPKGAEIREDSTTYKNLLAAMRKAGDPSIPLRVASYRPVWFQLDGRAKIDERFETEKVLKAVEQKLRRQFSFDARSFGQPVALSEVMALIQNVPGVIAVDVDALYRTGDSAGPHTTLIAAVPQPGSEATVLAAELLLLDSRPLRLGVMT